jgi:hypothetical protein
MSNSLKNLPPHIVRELRRHVSPKPLKVPSGRNAASTSDTNVAAPMSMGMKLALGGTLLLTATAGSFPLLATWWITNLNQKDDPLTAPQVRRGAFLNSGTRDIGKDPEWDFEKGTHKTKSGYAVIVAEESSSRKLPAEFLAMEAASLKKHEQGLIDFATGKKRQGE